MSKLNHSASIVVAGSPEDLYDMVSDVTRMGEWSPVCKTCWWDEGAGPAVGAWFTGRNELPDRTWETRSEVVAADPGHGFAFVVGGDFAGGSLPDGIAMFEQRFGAEAEAQIANRSEAAQSGIPATLAAIKKVAEAR